LTSISNEGQNLVLRIYLREGSVICKELADVLCDYIDGVLDPETKADFEEHFSDCPPCLAFLNTYKKTSHLCRETIGEMEIPPEFEKRLKEFIKKKFKKS